MDEELFRILLVQITENSIQTGLNYKRMLLVNMKSLNKGRHQVELD